MATLASSELRTRQSSFSQPQRLSSGGFQQQPQGGFQQQQSFQQGGFQQQSPPQSPYHSSSGGGSPSSFGSQNWGGSRSPSERPAEGGGGHPMRTMSPELRKTFVLLLVTAMCLHADQNLAAPNLSAIANDFQMTPMQKDTRLGGLVQFGFFLIGGAVSLLAGPATDQIDRVTMLSAVVLSGCVPSLAMSLWVPSSKAGFFYFFLARICTGIAIGGSFPVLFALAADIFPASQRPFVSACISAATNVGAAVGGLMSGIVGPRLGWRMPFRFVSIPALACAIIVRLVLVDPRSEKRKERAREDAAMANPAFSAWMGGEDANPAGYIRMEELDFTKFQRVLHVRTNMLIFAQSLPGCIPIACIVTFLADYLAVEQGMSVQASTAVTAVFGVSCLCFAVSGGLFGAQVYSKRKEKLPVLIGTMTCVAAIPFILLVNSPQSAVTSASGRPTIWAFFLALLGGCGAVAGPNIRAILMNVNDSETRGTVFSAFTLFDDLGKGLGPSIIVAVTSVLGRRLAYTMAFSLWWLSGAVLISLKEPLAKDVARCSGSLLPFKSK